MAPQASHSQILGRLEAELSALEEKAQIRQLAILEGVNLCSNDYLCLSRDPRLRQAVTDALAAGAAAGSTGSRLLSGNAPIWEELEEELARFAETEAALYFSSGYAANVGLISCVAGRGDVIFSDSTNHASIIDGIRLSGAHKVVFPHLDLDFLEGALRKYDQSDTQKFIIVESVFSMDGDRAPIADIVAMAQKHGAELIVDEAHATGVLGPQGRGLIAGAGVSREIFAAVHTCGKALASMGAYVCGSETLKQYLVNRARTFIFSTALPPYVAAQVRAAIRIVFRADAERSRLQELGTFLRRQLREAGFDSAQSDSQIVPVVLGENEQALEFAAGLREAGFAVRAIRPPTVPAGTARLRFSLHTGLSEDMLGRLVEELMRIRERLPSRAYSAPE